MTDKLIPDAPKERIPLAPCMSCPDGYVWNVNGPTGKACPVCKGYARLHLNGSPLTKEEWEAQHG